MKKATSFLAVLVLICTFALNCTAVFAAEYENAHLNVNKNYIRKGEKLNLTLFLSGFNGADEPVNVLKGTLKYDSAVFETPSGQDFVPADMWENVQFNPENGKFILFSRYGHSSDESVLNITLTAKNDLAAGNTYLEISNLKVSAGREDLFPNDAGILLNVISDNISPNPSGVSANSGISAEAQEFLPENEANLHGNVINGAYDNNETAVNSADKSKINIWLAAALIFLLLCAAVVIVYNKKRRTLYTKFLSVMLIVFALVLFTAGGVYAFSGKGDINGDGAVDYADAVLLQNISSC